MTDAIAAIAERIESFEEPMRRAVRDRGWEEGAYELQLMADWDHTRVPIVVAIPNFPSHEPSPVFAVVNDELTTDDDPLALHKIVTEEFPEPSSEDVSAIARLAVLFRTFDDEVGRPLQFAPDPQAYPQLPRAFEPPRYDEQNEEGVLRFYAYDPGRQVLRDCVLRLTPNGIKAEQRLVERQEVAS